MIQVCNHSEMGINKDMADAHLADRAARAEKIIAAPQLFKVCEGCDSIVAARVSMCPSCDSYRFNMAPEEVVAHAHLLASRPQRSVTIHDLS